MVTVCQLAVYAMEGKPLTAMNVGCFPTKTLDISVLKDVPRVGLGKMHEAVAPVARFSLRVLLVTGQTSMGGLGYQGLSVGLLSRNGSKYRAPVNPDHHRDYFPIAGIPGAFI